jgi:hypothetical protein
VKKYNFFEQLFIALDQLLNVFAFGYHDTTISARIGFFAKNTEKKPWVYLEHLINWGFKPIDGPDHCWKAYEADKHERFYEPNTLATVNLWLIALTFVPLIGLVLRIYTGLKSG